MASQADDGFHEIQLNGKQLVFLFMAATVVSVVIFLCGVLVGRGVRAERTVAQVAALNEAPAPDVLPSGSPAAPPIQAGADPRDAAPPVPVDEKSSAIVDDIRPDSAKAADTARAVAEKPMTEKPASDKSPDTVSKGSKGSKGSRGSTEVSNLQGNDKSPKTDKAEKAEKVEKAPEKPAPKPFPEPAAAAPPPPKEPVAATSGSTNAGDGYAVQVAAVNVRTDADAIAKKFNSKGYSAYVEVPPNGTGTVFRVRIGTFKTKHEAETIAAKLQKEEQIKPWVTR